MGLQSRTKVSPLLRTLRLIASLLALGCTPVVGPRAHSTLHDGDDGGVRSSRPEGSTSSASMAAGAGDASPGDANAGPMRSSTHASSMSPDSAVMQDAAPNDTHAAAGASAEASSGDATRPERSRDALPLSQTEVPDETSDVAALAALSKWDQLPVFAAVRRQHQNSSYRGASSSRDSQEPTIYEDDDRDLNNFICRSADARLGLPSVGYTFDHDRCQEDYVHGVELARFEGSGRMSRLWFSASTSTPGLSLSDEILRFYVDDNPRPLLQARLVDVVSGAAGEIFAAPFASAAKNSMTWFYPVVFSSKLIITIDNLRELYFYEVEAVLDDEPQQRWAPLERLPVRDAAQARLATPSPRSATDSNQKAEHLSLGASESRQITLEGPMTTNELRLRVPTAKLTALEPVTISVKWDEQDGNAIDVPLLALFAARRAPPENNSLALVATLAANDTVMSLRLPMPFQTSSAWTVTNTGSETVDFDLSWVGSAGVPAAEFGNLHVQTFETALPASKTDQTVAQISSRGRLVGVCFDIAGDPEVSTVGEAFARPLLFSTGDLNFSIDGQSGTFAISTDTYNDDSFHFSDAPRSTPFAQSWNVVRDPQRSPQGEISLCRWHVLGNEVDFAQELKVTRELAQRDPSYVKLHRSIAYYYAR